jgi:hypothetical protein
LIDPEYCNGNTQTGMKPGMVVFTCNPRIQETEAKGSRIEGQLGLHSEFQANLDYLVRPYLKRNKKQTQKPKRSRGEEGSGAGE